MDKHKDKMNGSQCTCSNPESCATAMQLKMVISWAVNYSLSQLDSVSEHESLAAEDFIGVHKVTVSMEHLRVNSSGLPSSFEVKEYSPRVFAHLRFQFGSGRPNGVAGEFSELFRASWTFQPPAWDTDCRGHSNSRFLRSADRAFYAKTIARAEAVTLRQMLSDYWSHVTASHSASMLPQLLALYRISMAGSKFYILIMSSVFNSSHPLIRKFDLKGCSVARSATKADVSSQGVPTLKDLDFAKTGECLLVGPAVKSAIMECLRRDVQFLQQHNTMDYSLLVGVHEWSEDCGNQREHSSSAAASSSSAAAAAAFSSSGVFDRYLIPSLISSPDVSIDQSGSSRRCKQQFYSLGVIDILTNYGWMKRAASVCKRVRYPAAGGSANTFSTVPPAQYADRFLGFAESCFQ